MRMTENEWIERLSGRFQDRFAEQTAREVRDADDVGVLYRLATGPDGDLPKAVRHKVAFRGAYVLERIYFDDREAFAPFVEAFCRRDFPACEDPSAQRHFGKMMADLLGRYAPDDETLDRIAEAAARWAVDPASKTAVRVWAVEVLRQCRARVGWVAELWDDLMETMTHDATPGIANRLRNRWRPLR